MKITKERFFQIVTESGLKEETANKLWEGRPEEYEFLCEDSIRLAAESFHGDDEAALRPPTEEEREIAAKVLTDKMLSYLSEKIAEQSAEPDPKKMN